MNDPEEALPGWVVEYVFWFDCVVGVEVDPNVLDVEVLAEPLNEPAALALPLALMEPVRLVLLFWYDPAFDEGAAVVLPIEDELGVVDCMLLVPPNWPAADVLVVGVDGEPLEPKLDDEALEELEVCACRPSAAAKSAVAPQVISVLVFFIYLRFS